MAKNGKSKSNGHDASGETTLAEAIGDEFVRMLEASLPRIGAAVEDEERNASFTATAAFRHTKHGLVARLECRERIPLAAVEFMVRNENGQLELFSGPHAAGEVADMPSAEA